MARAQFNPVSNSSVSSGVSVDQSKWAGIISIGEDAVKGWPERAASLSTTFNVAKDRVEILYQVLQLLYEYLPLRPDKLPRGRQSPGTGW